MADALDFVDRFQHFMLPSGFDPGSLETISKQDVKPVELIRNVLIPLGALGNSRGTAINPHARTQEGHANPETASRCPR